MRPSAPSRLPYLALACTLLAPLPPVANAQTHKVHKAESVVRAVGVYEWTGDLTKPTAARLIPVTLFINGELQDASIFQPQPIPFALLPGNQYILQQAGLPQGLLDLRSASKQPDAATGNVDGWWAFGIVTREAVAPTPKLRASRTLSSISSSKGDIPPAPITTSDTDKDNNRTENSPDPERPTLRRRSTTPNGKSTPSPTQPDPSATPPDDPERPSLKRHPAAPPPDDASSTPSDSAQRSTTAVAADPDRPVLHRGVPANSTPVERAEDRDLARLAGLPKDLHQLVAVSDAANRPEHDFTRPWTDDAEHRAIATQLEALARAQLAAYSPIAPPSPNAPRSGSLVGQTTAEGAPASPTGGPTFTPAQGSSTTSTRPHPATTLAAATQPAATPAARRRAARAAAAKQAAAQQKSLSSLPLDDEDLRAYTLSYGAVPTFVLTAHTPSPASTVHAPLPSVAASRPGFVTPSSASRSSTSAESTLTATPPSSDNPSAEGPTRYITLIAQQDTFGHLQVAFSSVTDSAHLDRTPWLRLVGPVDVEASNRASLLFELREQGSRQFALFRVLSGHADTLFTTGTTQ